MPAAVTGLENRGSVRFHNLQSFWHDDGFTAGPLGFGAGVGGQGFASSLRLEVRGQGAKGLMAGTGGTAAGLGLQCGESRQALLTVRVATQQEGIRYSPAFGPDSIGMV